MDSAERIYEEIVELAQKVIEKRKLGWILKNEDGEIIQDDIVFYNEFNQKCVAVNYKGLYAPFVEYGKTNLYSSSTLLVEYKESLRVFKKYDMIKPDKVVSLGRLMQA